MAAPMVGTSPSPIRTRTVGADTVIEMSGKLDGILPPESREQVLSLVKPGCRLVLDLSGLSEVSGVGVRMLLMLVRMVRAAGGTISATGVSRELSDLAEAAGFRQLFRQAAPAIAAPRRARAAHRRLSHASSWRVRPAAGVPDPVRGNTGRARDQFLGVLASRNRLHPGAVRTRSVRAVRRDSLPVRLPRRGRVRHDGLRPGPR